MNPSKDDNNYSFADKVFIYIDDSEPDSKTWESGGICQDQKNDFRNRSDLLKNEKPRKLDGEVMGVLRNELLNKLVYCNEETYESLYGMNGLDPRKTTFQEIRDYAIIELEYQETTIEGASRLWKKFETHPIYRIDLQHPSPQQFNEYFSACKKFGVVDRSGNLVPATKIALVNRKKAWYVLLSVFGLEDIFPKPKKIRNIPDTTRNKAIPTPETVYEMLHYPYVKNRDLNRYIQYLFFFGFFIGLAPEKEWIIKDYTDITIDDLGNRTIECERTKTTQLRVLKLEETIATSPVHKSIINYLKYTRPKFAKDSELALFPNPKTGYRWNESGLRGYLSRYGKIVYPKFYPYLMRHWCGTARFIEWEKSGSAYEKVNYWLGHKKKNQTKTYVDFAHLFNDNNGSWLSRALKRNSFGGLHESRLNAQQTKKEAIVEQNPSRRSNGSAGVRQLFSCNFAQHILKNGVCCAKAINISLNLFLFSFYRLFVNYFLSLFFQRTTADSPQYKNYGFNKTSISTSFPEGIRVFSANTFGRTLRITKGWEDATR